MPRGIRCARAVACAALVHAAGVNAAPPTAAELAKVCGNAEDQAQCGRLIEARQLPKLRSVASREGDALRIELLPVGSTVFRDAINIIGARSYAVWDYVEDLESVVLFATNGDRTEFWWVQRRGGGEFRIPAEPVLAPGHRQFATADFCAQDCDNEIAVWRIDASGVHKALAFAPNELWQDASVVWKNANTLAIEYRRASDTAPLMVERRLDDASWIRVVR
jgi:hypothetical protein